MISLITNLILLQTLPNPRFDFSTYSSAFSAKEGDLKAKQVERALMTAAFSVRQVEVKEGMDVVLLSRDKNLSIDYQGSFYGRLVWKVTKAQLSKKYVPDKATGYNANISYDLTIDKKEVGIVKSIAGKSPKDLKEVGDHYLIESGTIPLRIGSSSDGYVGATIRVQLPEIHIEGKGKAIVMFTIKDFSVTNPPVLPPEKIKP